MAIQPGEGRHQDEFEQRMALDAMPGGTDMEAHRRLARYYRRAGFRSVRGTDHRMIRMLT
jgi:hypothetical protein